MTQTKYYLKVNCDYCDKTGQIDIIIVPYKQDCILCRTKGFTRGADVTELIERIQKKFNYSYEDDFMKPFKDLIEVVEE